MFELMNINMINWKLEKSKHVSKVRDARIMTSQLTNHSCEEFKQIYLKNIKIKTTFLLTMD